MEFQVGNLTFPTWQPAASYALGQAVSKGKATLDVLIYSEQDAHDYGGDDAVERYNEDPDASVFERFEITVNNVGRVS